MFWKKGIVAVAFACLLALGQPMTAQAAPIQDTYVSDEPMACLDYTSSVRTSMSISDGNANIYVSIVGYPGITDRVVAYAHLQRYEGGEWVTYKSFDSSDDDYSTSIQVQTPVEKGYKYRVRGSVYAYSGNVGEHITKYSKAESYYW